MGHMRFFDPLASGLDNEISQAGLVGDIALKIREILRQICTSWSVEIVRGHVSRDHIHLFVSFSSQVTISRLVPKMKGKVLISCCTHIQAYSANIGADTFGHAATSAVAVAMSPLR